MRMARAVALSFFCYLFQIGLTFSASSERAVISYRLHIPPDEISSFLKSVTEVADKQNFAVRTRYPDPRTKQIVAIDLFRDDLKIVLTNPFERSDFILAVRAGYKDQSMQFTQNASHDFVSTIEKLVNKIPSGTFESER